MAQQAEQLRKSPAAAPAPVRAASAAPGFAPSPAVQRLEEISRSLNARPEVVAQRVLGEMLSAASAVQRAPANRTGLPDALKSGVEALSGHSMDDVRVHRNSGRPAQLQAHAYAQGTDIHVAPGQDRHLPHEAWHVAQQKQKRVRPTISTASGVPVNDEARLEREADLMGARALRTAPAQLAPGVSPPATAVAQRQIDRRPLAEGAGAAVLQCLKVQVDKVGEAKGMEYDHEAFGKVLQADAGAAKTAAAEIIARAFQLDELLIPHIADLLTDNDLQSLANGTAIQNKRLSSRLKNQHGLRLHADDLAIRPWLRSMYGIAGPENSAVLSLGTTAPEAANLEDELGIKPVHVKKGASHAARAAVDAIKNSLDGLAGRMSLTICGHIAYNDSPDPADWTLAGFSIDSLAATLQQALAEVEEGSTLAQLNLLSCGSEHFGRALFNALEKEGVVLSLMTAIRDEIPITPGPKGAQRPLYLFAGDYDDESSEKSRNILKAVVGFKRLPPPQENAQEQKEEAKGKEEQAGQYVPRWSKHTLQQHAFTEIRVIIGQKLKKAMKDLKIGDVEEEMQKTMGPTILATCDLISEFMLPPAPSGAEMQKLRHNE
jgi:hypothetical protein